MQSAKFRTTKFLHPAKNFILASLILSQSVNEMYLISVQFLVKSLIELSDRFLFDAILSFFNSFA